MQVYNAAESYLWNYEHAPDPRTDVAVPEVPGDWRFCGLPVDSPLGMPAGPLLNGRWILYYAALGFDVLTYKTVRSSARECYPLPNLVPVDVGQLGGNEECVTTAARMSGSWAVSFGMPSSDPEVWRRDIEWTRSKLPRGKVLSVSVVGSIQEGWTLDDLADDYARCARWAVESGADCVETNFSCPNVATCDGQLYQQPDDAQLVAERVRAAVGRTPFIVKVGHVNERSDAERLLESLSPYVDALAMTNSVATQVRDDGGQLLFDGQKRGICGAATREASLRQLKLFVEIAGGQELNTRMIGVGGVSEADHVSEYLAAGAEAVHIATAAMVNPEIALRIRAELADAVEKQGASAVETADGSSS